MKRFWKEVGIEKRKNMFTVTLDGRVLKTPSGNPLLLPANKSLVASVIAAEWDHQHTCIRPHSLPMTSIASRAIDTLGDSATASGVRSSLLYYLDTDTVCFYQEYPSRLKRLQIEHWDPLLNWVRETFDVDILKHSSILSQPQPSVAKEKLANALASFDRWELAAMERVTHATKSFIIGLALVKKQITVEQAALAATVEVCSQIEKWGEVEDTHDVDYQDIRRQLASAACLLSNS